MNPAERRNLIEEAFVARYGAAPQLWTRAPGRVDLMGSHTDYNQGFVMTMAVDRDVRIAARPRDDRRIRVASLNLSGEGNFHLDRIEFDSVTL